MKIEKIDHVHFGVNDIKKFQEAFGRLLGLKFTPIQDFPGVKAVASVSTGPAELALIKPSSPENWVAQFIQEHGEGIYSFCLKVSDFDDIVADFDARGIKYRILPERKRFG